MESHLQTLRIEDHEPRMHTSLSRLPDGARVDQPVRGAGKR